MPSFANGLPQTQRAVTYAEQMHAGQRRADGTPFILHPLEVASLLYYAGAPDHLIAAGVMHDLIEKTDASAPDLTTRFGTQIARLVLAVSDDDQLGSYSERKAALRQQVSGAGEEALMLFAADKLSKVRELRRRDLDRSLGGRHDHSWRSGARSAPQALSALARATRGTSIRIAARSRPA
jgi:(p)ppGpp synthase/HD superfamily hydrolase